MFVIIDFVNLMKLRLKISNTSMLICYAKNFLDIEYDHLTDVIASIIVDLSMQEYHRYTSYLHYNYP